MINWLKELLEEKSILWWFSVSTIMLFIFLIFVNQSSEKDLLGFLTESTFYVIEKEQDALPHTKLFSAHKIQLSILCPDIKILVFLSGKSVSNYYLTI